MEVDVCKVPDVCQSQRRAQSNIHPMALVDPSAKVHPSVKVGPFCLIEENVEIGPGCELLSHVVIKGDTKIGANNKFFQFATIGEQPPDKKYSGECTRLVIGDNNVFREAVTVHIGTIQDEAETMIGSGNLMLAYVHIAHDCQVGDGNVFANNASLAGHVKVGSNVNFGGFAKVSQFCSIGDFSFVCADCTITKDVPAFVKVAPGPARPVGLNTVGMERYGLSKDTRALLKQAYRIAYQKKLTVQAALAELEALNTENNVHLSIFIQSIRDSTRGIIR
jgi:UDP-N-acetylglucosamine acyltransferase